MSWPAHRSVLAKPTTYAPETLTSQTMKTFHSFLKVVCFVGIVDRLTNSVWKVGLENLHFLKQKKFPIVNLNPSNLALKKRACNPANNVESVKDMKLWSNDIEAIFGVAILSPHALGEGLNLFLNVYEKGIGRPMDNNHDGVDRDAI